MVQDKSKFTFLKLIVKIFLIAIATAVLVAGILIYKGIFNKLNYSNWLFFVSMGYIAIGGFSAFGSFMNTNNFSYKYVSTVMTGDTNSRKKIDDMLINSGFSFMLKMIAIGVLVFLVSVSANMIL